MTKNAGLSAQLAARRPRLSLRKLRVAIRALGGPVAARRFVCLLMSGGLMERVLHFCSLIVRFEEHVVATGHATVTRIRRSAACQTICALEFGGCADFRGFFAP